MLSLDPATTALVLIDLQKGTLAMPMAPYGAAEVVANAARLVDAFAASGAIVIQVHVAFSPDMSDRPGQDVDVPLSLPPGALPADFSALAPDLAARPAHAVIVKRQWSAFYGTELDLQLRRRRITHVVIGGVMSNFGVESTARDAWQHDYSVVVAEDAASAPDAAMHAFAMEKVLPRVSRVRRTAEIVAALAAA